jgi:Fe-S-cluster containining protein
VISDLAADLEAHFKARRPQSGVEFYAAIDEWVAKVMPAVKAFVTRTADPSSLSIVEVRPACKSGCAYCCHQNVMVGPREVFALWDYVREHWTAAELEELRARVEEGRRMVWRALGYEGKGNGPRRVPHESVVPRLAAIRRPCPFLDRETNRCRVYPVRPLGCRHEHSTDAGVCKAYMEDPDRISSLRLTYLELIWSTVWTLVHRDEIARGEVDVSALDGAMMSMFEAQ